MSSFDQALLLLSARCKRVEEDLGIKVVSLVLEADTANGGVVFQQFDRTDGKFVESENKVTVEPKTPRPNVALAVELPQELLTPGPEVVLENDKVFAPGDLPFAEDNLQPMGFTGDDIVAPEEEEASAAPDKKKKK